MVDILNLSHFLVGVPESIQREYNITDRAKAMAHYEDDGYSWHLLLTGFTIYRDDDSTVYISRDVINKHQIYFEKMEHHHAI